MVRPEENWFKLKLGKVEYPQVFFKDGKVVVVHRYRFEIWTNEMKLLLQSTGFADPLQTVTPLGAGKYMVVTGAGEQCRFHVYDGKVADCDIAGSFLYVLKTHFVVVDSEGRIALYDRTSYQRTDTKWKCRMYNAAPVLDLQGDWLVFNTTEATYDSATPLELPRPGPLLNRLLQNLSATTIDTIIKIAQISHRNLKKYLNNEQIIKDTFTKLLNALNETNKQYLQLVNLATMETMFVFSPPGGCSKVSLSPYDMALTTVTLRGDDILVWDFTFYNKQISLLHKLKRGKTPGVVKQIVWNSVSNLGILSKSGSLHWYDLDWDSEYHSWVLSMGFHNFTVYKDSILAFDSKNCIKIIDFKGCCKSQYKLLSDPIDKPQYNSVEAEIVQVTPKIDIEYTEPYEFNYKNRKFEFHHQELTSNHMLELNEDSMKIDFGRANGVAVFHDSEESISLLLNE